MTDQPPVTAKEVNEIIEKNIIGLVLGYVIGSLLLGALLTALAHPIVAILLTILALIVFTIRRFIRFLNRLATAPVAPPRAMTRPHTVPWHQHAELKFLGYYIIVSMVFGLVIVVLSYIPIDALHPWMLAQK